MVICLNMSIQMSTHEMCVWKQVLISSLIADIETQTKCSQPLLLLPLQLSRSKVNDLIRKN